MLSSILQRNKLFLLPQPLLAALICLIVSCNSHKQPGKKVTPDSVLINSKNLSIADSLQLINDIDSADYVSIFKKKTNIWLSKSLDNGQLKWSNFHLTDFWEKSDHPPHPDTPGNKFLTDYAIFLKWSPDSTYILDVGSYGVTMAKDKKGNLYIESGDVDSEVDLYNCKAKTSERMLFFGPATIANGAHWMDSSQVALLGLYKPGNDSHHDTLLWLIDAKSKFFRKYIYHKGE